MRIITYNLRSGGSGKSHWTKVLEDHDPDVFLVQESYDPAQHLPPLIHGDRHRNAHWKSVSGLKWGSAVYVKNRVASRIHLPDFHGHVVGVGIDGSAFPISGGRALCVFSVHAPEQNSYHQAVNSILDIIRDTRGDNDLIIGGDFNLTVGERLDSEELKTSNADRAIAVRLREEFGLVGAWQAANPGLPLQQTLRWSRDKVPPYHCDGIFIPMNWVERIKSCEVLSGPDWNELSDHNPVRIDLE